jgi:hypothetical protein
MLTSFMPSGRFGSSLSHAASAIHSHQRIAATIADRRHVVDWGWNHRRLRPRVTRLSSLIENKSPGAVTRVSSVATRLRGARALLEAARMRNFLFALALVGCAGPAPKDTGGDDTPVIDAPPQMIDATTSTCALPDDTAATGALTALKSQRCNVPGTMGAQKWYRLSASLPGSAMDIIQLELWDGRGPFTGGTVQPGTYTIAATDTLATCGVCLRAVGDKGAGTAKTYFATGGSVEVTAVGGAGATLSATITNAVFAEVDAAGNKVNAGCAANVASSSMSGTVVDVGGGGGGGGGGGACPTTVGD